jgi:hypothetical protein
LLEYERLLLGIFHPGKTGENHAKPESFMRKVLIGLIALAVAELSSGSVAAQRGRGLSEQAAAREGWLSDYRKAKEVARQTAKPLMVVFRCVP